jgi:signal transduction histidine kinase
VLLRQIPTAVGFLLLATLAPEGRCAEAPSPEGRPITPETVLVVGVSSETSLYSRYEGGQAIGFAADILDAIAAEMQLKITRTPLALHEIPEALQSGRIDIVQLWAETPERREFADFSVPALLLKLVVVVRKDDPRIRTLDDLRGKVIATGSIGSVATEFVKRRCPDARIVNTSVPSEILPSVADGTSDAAVVARLSALWGIRHQGHANLRVLDLPIDGYDVRHCLAVRKGDTVLLGRLNEGLAIIRDDGRYAAIYHRWFGAYEPRRFTSQEVSILVAVALGLGMAIALAAFLRQRRLTRRIASQANELLGQRSLHAALFDNHPLSTCVLEAAPDGGPPRVLSLNRVAGQLCGIDPVAATGRPLDTLSVSAEMRSYFDEVITHWPAQGETSQIEIRLRESRTVLETTLVPLAPASGGAARMCVLSADVTRRRLADREIAQNRRLRALGELVGGIAHEFNNLLTPVLAQATMLASDHSRDPELVGELRVIEDAARRSAALTRRLLAFGRRSDDAVASTDARAALDSCVALLRPTFDRRIEWQLTLPEGLPPVGCDPTDLHQIAFNLIINARDTLMERLAESRGDDSWTPRLAIALTTLPPESHLMRQPRAGATLAGWQRITVTDTGKGIAAEHLERIYEPFFTTKEVGQGTGIGLATVWHLVNEAGGFIDVDSTPGTGSTFTVTLPVWAEADDHTPAAPCTAAAPAPAAVPPRRILLVEDEGIVASAVTAMLQRQGHDVTHAIDGQTAWAEMKADPGRFDVLLVDINMPRMNGIDLVRRVRSTAWAGRIVVMSGRISDPDLRTLEQLRVHRMLPKPFTPEDIAAALGAAER